MFKKNSLNIYVIIIHYASRKSPSSATNDMQKRILCEPSHSTYSHKLHGPILTRVSHIRTEFCDLLQLILCYFSNNQWKTNRCRENCTSCISIEISGDNSSGLGSMSNSAYTNVHAPRNDFLRSAQLTACRMSTRM